MKRRGGISDDKVLPSTLLQPPQHGVLPYIASESEIRTTPQPVLLCGIAR